MLYFGSIRLPNKWDKCFDETNLLDYETFFSQVIAQNNSLPKIIPSVMNTLIPEIHITDLDILGFTSLDRHKSFTCDNSAYGYVAHFP